MKHPRVLGILVTLLLTLFTSAALAADVVCPELSAVQRWAGYLSWMGFLKVIAVVALTGGLCTFFYGFIKWGWEKFWAVIRDIADVIAYVVSFGLIAAGVWTPEVYQLWPVLSGCILFGASVLFTIHLRKIKGDDPTVISVIYAVVWGAVALYYKMPEIGFLTVGAIMGVLGFSVAVSPFCYAFGFRREKDIAAVTAASIILLIAYSVGQILYPYAISAINIFKPGIFWLGSFVGFLGLLILSSRWYVEEKEANYAWIQLVTICSYVAGVAVGMTFGINALAGMAGTFLVFYAAAKMTEIETDTAMGFGLKLMIIGAIFSGAWFVASQNEALVKAYLTMTLPS